jgi:hypothetical protein
MSVTLAEIRLSTNILISDKVADSFVWLWLPSALHGPFGSILDVRAEVRSSSIHLGQQSQVDYVRSVANFTEINVLSPRCTDMKWHG